MNIDWKKFAKLNGLSPEDFKQEIYLAAVVVASLDIDEHGDDTVVKFTCSDEIGKLEMCIRRPEG